MLFDLLIPLFLLIALGFFLKKIKFLTKDSDKFLNKFVYFVAFPFYLFAATMSVMISPSIPLVVAYPIITIIIIALAFVASWKLKSSKRGAFIQNSFRSNMGYLGLPIIISLLGKGVGGDAAIILGIGNIANLIFAVIVLEAFSNRTKKNNLIKQIVTNPFLIAIMAGILFSTMNIILPQPLTNTIKMVSDLAQPLILITIGSSLSLIAIKKNYFLIGASSAIKLLVMPLIAYLVMVFVFPSTPTLTQIIVLYAAMPTAVASFTFAKEYASDHELANATINLTTLLCLVTVPLIAILLGIQ